MDVLQFPNSPQNKITVVAFCKRWFLVCYSVLCSIELSFYGQIYLENVANYATLFTRQTFIKRPLNFINMKPKKTLVL